MIHYLKHKMEISMIRDNLSEEKNKISSVC